MPVKHILLAILIAAVWGCNFVFVKLGVHEIPPYFLCAIRFILVSIPVIFFVPKPDAPFKLVAAYGIFMFAMQFSCMFAGIAAGMTAGMTALLAQTSIFFSILFAAAFLKEIPTLWQILGALVSFSGIGVAALHIDNNMTLAGFFFVIAGAAAWGLGNLITRKLGRVNMFSLVSWGSLISFPPLLLLSLLIEGPAKIIYSIHHFSWLGLVALLYIVYMSTWVGYGAWTWLLSRYTVVTVVPFTLLVPVFAMLGSMLVLGEQLEPWKITVFILIISGLGINLLVPRLIAHRKLFIAKHGVQ